MTEYERGYMDGIRDRQAPAPVKHLVTKVKIIQDVVCEFYGLTLEAIKQKSRKAEIAHPRQVLSYFLMMNTAMTFQSIGRIFGKDHTTVIYAKRRIEDLTFSDPMVKDEVETIKKRIKEALDEYKSVKAAI
jgi:chromosomal replication initiator protein